MNLRGALALLIAWPFTVVYCLAVVAISLLSLRFAARAMVRPVAHTWGAILLWLAGVRLTVEGEEHLRERRPRVLILNHPSTLDTMIGARILPPASMPIAKKEIIFVPGVNLAWWALRYGFLDRSNSDSARRMLDKLREQVRRERLSVVMAPEGTRSRDGTLGEFKKGAFHLAMQIGAPIYPVVIAGAHALWPRGALTPRSGEVKVVCLPPISTESWTAEGLDLHVAEVRAVMDAVIHGR